MIDHERAMLVYLELSVISQIRQQVSGRDRFLVLAGMSATKAGCLPIAERCRSLVLSENPRHLLRKYETIAEALRDPDFAGFEQQMQRFCSLEEAEHLLSRHDQTITDEVLELDGSVDDQAAQLLGRMET